MKYALSERGVGQLRSLVRRSKRPMRRFSEKRSPKLEGAASGGVHLAYCKAAAGTGTTIVCYLDTDGTGEEITVNCSICNGANLNAATPLLADGTRITVIKDGTSWYCTSPFAGSCETECECAT